MAEIGSDPVVSRVQFRISVRCIGAGKILLGQNSLRFSSDLGNDTFCFHAISVDSKLPPTQKVCFLLHSFENHNFVKNSRS